MNTRNILSLIVMGLIVLGIAANCSQSSQFTGRTAPDKISLPSPTSTPTILLATVASLPASPTASPTPAPVIVAPSPASPTATSPISGFGLLPRQLTQISLAPPGESLLDFLLDRDSARIYVIDTAGQLHVLDANTYARLATLPTTGQRLTLDTMNQRLYITLGSTGVTIVDTNSLTVVGTIPGGGHVTVDTARNRFYSSRKDGSGIRLYDGVTFEELGRTPQPGIPVYNPLRDELYIVAHTVFIADPETLEIKADLLPDITANQPFLYCNGCKSPEDAHIFLDRNLLVVEIRVNSVGGKGGGISPQPRLFDATTLVELTDPAQRPAVEYSCNHWRARYHEGRISLADPAAGYIYREAFYFGYVAYANLLVEDLEGNLVTWRDGLRLGITNPNTKQMYISYPRGVLVLDLTTLSPIGMLPPLSCLFLDQEQGLIYAFQNESLIIFSQAGDQAKPLLATDLDTLPGAKITLIQPSPHYHDDQTLFVYQANRLYRSQNGGQTWARLGNSLPELYDSDFRGLSLSPDFASDQTLFTYGYMEEQGIGVYRSTDGGDTWQPMWNGLNDLRVYDVRLSPAYATDGTLLAYARFQHIVSDESGYSLFRSTDQGLNWTLVMTASNEASLSSTAADLMPVLNEPTTRLRTSGSDVERSNDGGQTWEPVMIPSPEHTVLVQVLPSPRFATDQTLYALRKRGLFRSMDGGETWQRWTDARLPDQSDTNELTALAISPVLDNAQHQLFIGTAAGEFWVLEPTEMAWEVLD